MSQVCLLAVLLGLLFSQGLTASVLDTMLESWKNFSEQCQKTMARDPPATGPICSRMYDNYSCWPDTPANTTANVSCPWYLPWYNKVKDGYVFKNCSPDGQWVLDSDGNPWRDSSQCEHDAMDKLNEEAFIKLYLILRIMHIVGYSLSLAALFLALLILIGFRKLHCMRNYIHMNLFASFILRAISILISDAVINTHHKINDYNIQELLQRKVSIGCRVAMVLMQYSVVASYYWLFVEGLYLLNLLVIAVFSEKSYFNIYLCIGWGTPVLVVVPWVVVKYLYENRQCWSYNDNMAYWWIIRAPILLVILINFFIFLRIIQILVSKLKAHQMRYTDYKFRLAKSTLTLIPLLGIHEIVTVFVFDETAKGMVRHAKLFFELFLSSFQGLLVAILYCFVNKEVQSELLKKWKRWKLGKDIEEEYKHTHSQTPHVKVEGAGCEKLNLISNCNNGTGKTRHTLQDGPHTCENIGTSTTEQITLSERTHCYGFPQEIAESTF